MKKINSIDEYMAELPEEKRAILEKIRAIVRNAAPEAAETISYGMPAFDHHGHLIAFAAFRNHYSIFPLNGTFISGHKKELEPFATTKGSIHFSYDRPLPQKLIRKIIAEKIKENEMHGKRRG